MLIDRYTATWSGFVGSPGYTNLYFLDSGSTDRTSVVRAFFAACAAILAPTVHIQISQSGDILDDGTGLLEGVWALPGVPTTDVVGGGGGVYSAPTGACIAWTTNGINRNHKIRGRSFMVPLAGDAYQNDGSLLPNSVNVLSNAAEGLISGSENTFGVWSRPVNQAGGKFAIATSARVRDIAAVLRSRRD